MKIVCDGDSWTFGSEILDPSLPSGVADWDNLNDSYRRSRIWPSYLGTQLDAEVVNLAYPADDNGTILNRTLTYLAECLSRGEKPSDLLVIVGWSSPERNFFWFDDGNFRHRWRVWPQNAHFHPDARRMQRKLWRAYVDCLWSAEEYIPRFVMNVTQLQNFCDAKGIPWMCFNAFYQSVNKNIDQWNSMDVSSEVRALRMDQFQYMESDADSRALSTYNYGPLWDSIDPVRFYRKDQPRNTFKDFVEDALGENDRWAELAGWHPTPRGHQVWADEVAKYIKDNGLI
jgi:hypothetical protein